jgi:hypothetical protein
MHEAPYSNLQLFSAPKKREKEEEEEEEQQPQRQTVLS